MSNYLDLLTCSVCLEIYTNPVTLNCLHSFCKQCIEKCSKDQRVVICPICRTEIEVKSIKDDFRIKEFVSLLESFESETVKPFKNCDVCDEDIDAIEVHLCKDCGTVLCMGCRINHEKARRTKNHTVYALSAKPIPYCKEHSEKLKYYCDDPKCKKLLCVSCALLFHDGHDKLTIKQQTDKFTDEIAKNVEVINTRVTELRSYTSYSKLCKTEIEQKFKEMDDIASKRRDFIVKQANESYQREKITITKLKNELICKFEENIVKLEASDVEMSPVLKYTKEVLNKKSYHDVNEINREVNNILENKWNMNFKMIEIKKLEMIPENFNEANVRMEINCFIGKLNMEVSEDNEVILTNKRSTKFYEKICNPRIISRILPSKKYLFDILYDKENDEIISLGRENNKEFLCRNSKNGNIDKFFIERCSFGYRQNYLAMLPKSSVLILCYADKDSPDRLIEVDKNFKDSKIFHAPFCNVKDIISICSSPCRNFIMFLSANWLSIFKYSVNTGNYEKANLPGKWKICNPSTISVNENLDHITFGHFKQIHIFSFKQEMILRSFGLANNCYESVAFVNENFLIAGLGGCSLNVFDASNGNLLRKFRRFIDNDKKEYKICSPQDLISVGNNSCVILNQNCEILNVSL